MSNTDINQTIMVLDDDPYIGELLEDILSIRYKALITDDYKKALEMLGENKIDAMLVDFNMPEINGVEFIDMAKQKYPDVAYIIITGNKNIDTAIDALHTGVYDFIQKPFELEMIYKSIDNALMKRMLIIENRRYKENLEQMVRQRTKELEKSNSELQHSREKIIGILSRAAEFKDFETGQHCLRVSLYSEIIARGLGLGEHSAALIRQAAPVHDIGKIGIPEQILLKHGKLDDHEFNEMKKHCLYGEEILKSGYHSDFTDVDLASDDALLRTASLIAKSHHERVDGSGYPEGLKNDEIPLEARIVAVADVYDALGSSRSYKKAWTEQKCQDFIRENAGILFDGEVVKAFMMNLKEIIEIKDEIKDKRESYSYLY